MASPLHVALVAIPEASISTLHGLYDVLQGFALAGEVMDALPVDPPFRVEIVSTDGQPLTLASGLSTPVHRDLSGDLPDLVLVPSIVLGKAGWQMGRYPELVQWLRAAHQRGAVLCSACSGVFLLAETGLLSGQDITMHWMYSAEFQKRFADVIVHPDKALVVGGDRQQFVTSGAATSWHDLILYLIARTVGRTAAQAIANVFALQWHQDGLGPYIVFNGQIDHADAAIAEAQQWLNQNYAQADPVADAMARSGLTERTFMRRFREATKHTPLGYVQLLRVEDAKRRLERTDASIETIGWQVGYEDGAFFRRLFKRITGVTPGHYRRRFGLPPLSTS